MPSILGSALCFVFVLSKSAITPLSGVIFFALLILHLIYIYLLKAPTPKGRRIMDELEGFKLYLELAEKDDLNRKHPPELTPELFEKYLPYAIALGVEQAWAQRFVAVFSRLNADSGHSYRPGWYQGSFNPYRPGSFATSLSSEFNSAISSAATPPGSSSGGGGGGFSGGGGGGGGGGGW